MFRQVDAARLDEVAACHIEVDGHQVAAREGEPLAAALLKAAVTPMRHSVVSGAPRAPYCMMGVCFECLVEVDGVPNVQACMTPVRAGMTVRLQHGARQIGGQA
ncbi:(2Fe-2S)-binding protein [Denitromonas sp.]|uniref:(2Fe-2S)-binding protein n=1 Tax=Denitromonas sp. TaxID=2734609 RepID=UPI003A8A5318